jgi:hypothetical protein
MRYQEIKESELFFFKKELYVKVDGLALYLGDNQLMHNNKQWWSTGPNPNDEVQRVEKPKYQPTIKDIHGGEVFTYKTDKYRKLASVLTDEKGNKYNAILIRLCQLKFFEESTVVEEDIPF